jgi:dTDP-4-dehydrorhamnose 3,5-epimerase
MQYKKTIIPDVVCIRPEIYGDDRGFFLETYREDQFHAEFGKYNFVQDNHSGSRRGTLRGLHYQIKHSQAKLIRAVVGEIFDVAVDLRKNSPTFGMWVGEILSDKNRFQLWIPPGFAHGFYVLSDWAEVCYKATDYYAPDFERTIIWNDPAIGIEWPICSDIPLLMSEKDQHGNDFKHIELYE